jgi:hypothetical protein
MCLAGRVWLFKKLRCGSVGVFLSESQTNLRSFVGAVRGVTDTHFQEDPCNGSRDAGTFVQCSSAKVPSDNDRLLPNLEYLQGMQVGWRRVNFQEIPPPHRKWKPRSYIALQIKCHLLLTKCNQIYIGCSEWGNEIFRKITTTKAEIQPRMHNALQVQCL